MKLGYYDTMRMIYGLKGKIYYIDESEEECYYLKQLTDLDDLVYEYLMDTYQLPREPKLFLRNMTEVILPVLAAEGFFLSFSAGCFAAALGRSGVLLALAAFGVRCLIVLPCSIYPAMLVGERNRWRKLAVCGALLLLGMALELTLVPRLVQLALGTLS